MKLFIVTVVPHVNEKLFFTLAKDESAAARAAEDRAAAMGFENRRAVAVSLLAELDDPRGNAGYLAGIAAGTVQ